MNNATVQGNNIDNKSDKQNEKNYCFINQGLLCIVQVSSVFQK